MPFGNFTTLVEAIRAFQVQETEESFIAPSPLDVAEHFRSELELTLDLFDVECSEWAVCENLIYPVLREAIKPHADVLGLWSHASMYSGARLLGVPDYVIGKRSPLSKRVMDVPYAMIMEAKRNDFDMGWGQCLAAMHAARTLNGEPYRLVYGGVSDGFIWRFGKLQAQTFVRHPKPYDLSRLEELFGALNHLFELCRQQVLIPAAVA